MTENTVFVCPVCRTRLVKEGGSMYCTGQRRHCYDIASSGYVNLLPPGKKNNRKAGDDAEMLSCRRSFLSAGHYDKISDEAAAVALRTGRKILSFVDAGCGEGHHTVRIFKRLSENTPIGFAAGLDASKHGAAAGAKKAAGIDGNLNFAAANIFDMPIESSSLDAVFSLFAPVPDAEAARVLTPHGLLVVCSSGSRHLWQMREVLYGEPRLSPPLDRVPLGFRPLSASSLSYEITVRGGEIKDLFTMTPFYYRSPREGREKLLSLPSMTTEISVEYKVYEKI